MIEKGIRGGVSMINCRYSKANNKYMVECYDHKTQSTFIIYFDVKNLYGCSMVEALLTGGFERMDEDELEDWESHPCFLEVDLEYPKELHDLHNDYPLAPERLKANKVEKRIPNL